MPAVAVRGGGGVNGRRGVCNAVFSACCGKFVYRDAGKMPALRLLLIFSLRQIEQGCTVIRGLFAPLGLGPGSRWMQAGCLRYGSVPQASRLLLAQTRCLRYGLSRPLWGRARCPRYGASRLLLVQTRCLRYGASRLLLMQAGCVRYGVVPACGRTEWFHGLPLPARCVRRSGDYEMNRG